MSRGLALTSARLFLDTLVDRLSSVVSRLDRSAEARHGLRDSLVRDHDVSALVFDPEPTRDFVFHSGTGGGKEEGPERHRLSSRGLDRSRGIVRLRGLTGLDHRCRPRYKSPSERPQTPWVSSFPLPQGSFRRHNLSLQRLTTGTFPRPTTDSPYTTPTDPCDDLHFLPGPRDTGGSLLDSLPPRPKSRYLTSRRNLRVRGAHFVRSGSLPLYRHVRLPRTLPMVLETEYTPILSLWHTTGSMRSEVTETQNRVSTGWTSVTRDGPDPLGTLGQLLEYRRTGNRTVSSGRPEVGLRQSSTSRRPLRHIEPGSTSISTCRPRTALSIVGFRRGVPGSRVREHIFGPVPRYNPTVDPTTDGQADAIVSDVCDGTDHPPSLRSGWIDSETRRKSGG